MPKATATVAAARLMSAVADSGALTNPAAMTDADIARTAAAARDLHAATGGTSDAISAAISDATERLQR
ncbi:hypothetical protein ACLQ2J_36485 [Streptomyces cyaneofuscatus]|uniref:hypothetical protein n=1 Tax=Streptomyces cyaneofuscatus TaxID=66883 RepID=UPI003CFB03A4